VSGARAPAAAGRARGRERAPALAALVLAALPAIGGCGGIKAPDLFIVQRSGGVPGARLTLLVNEEGGVSCNGGPTRKLGDAELIEARTIQEDLHDPAAKHLSLAPGPRSVFSYRVRAEAGSVSFSDDSSGQPPVFHRLALFVLQTAQRTCHLPL
jgi:hypothetical protein